MSYADSPATYEAFARREPKVSSPGTYRKPAEIPQSVEKCRELLQRARNWMRTPQGSAYATVELARFLGASSAVWTATLREELQKLLASAGEQAIDPVLTAVVLTPRAEVMDDAQAVLVQIGQNSDALLNRLDNTLSPVSKAVLIRSLSHTGRMIPRHHFESALDDDDADVRDAAACAIATLAIREAIPRLRRRLALERNPIVLDSINDALEELQTA